MRGRNAAGVLVAILAIVVGWFLSRGGADDASPQVDAVGSVRDAKPRPNRAARATEVAAPDEESAAASTETADDAPTPAAVETVALGDVALGDVRKIQVPRSSRPVAPEASRPRRPRPHARGACDGA